MFGARNLVDRYEYNSRREAFWGYSGELSTMAASFAFGAEAGIAAGTLKEGSFSIIDWSGYPKGASRQPDLLEF
jgi:hypothetical protein